MNGTKRDTDDHSRGGRGVRSDCTRRGEYQVTLLGETVSSGWLANLWNYYFCPSGDRHKSAR